jgi:quinol-cytochrome oxidoreductase complex cytochrome b subunit
MRPSFFHHLHPPTIPAQQARWRYTLGAGGLAVYLLLVVIASGALLMFFYIPTPNDAAASIQQITFLVPFGNVVRNLHYWSAQILVVVTLIHLLRVIFTGAYAPPRQVNYLFGLLLLVLILLLDFSGYVLRWDEGVRWALVAGTNLTKTVPLVGEELYSLVVGGYEPGQATLIRFYAWHIFGLMLPVIIFGVWHLFKVRRDGGIAVPPPDARSDPTRITRVELVRREGLAALIASIALLLLSAFWPAPLAAPINFDNAAAADTLAPWFFLWVQQLLRWGEPFWMGVAIPGLVLIVLILIPYVLPRPPASQLGRWLPSGGRVAQVVMAIIGLVMLGLTLLALMN